jgi:hypothetical protein
MDRRSFIAAAATGAALAGSGEAAITAPASGRKQPKRQKAVLSGWLVQPNPEYPHLFALVADPKHARRLGSRTVERHRTAVWVHARGGTVLQAGPVRLSGWLHLGGFRDQASGYRARVLLADAELV